MKSYFHKQHSIKVLCFIVLLLCGITCFGESAPKNVLLLSSYHPSFPTFFKQIDGIKAAFKETPIQLDVEFLDSKRFYNKENFSNFYNLLSYKLKQLPKYNIIITSDDNALEFAITHKDDLFRGIPIVFCGVNNLEKAKAAQAHSDITGVIEAISLKETLTIMKKLFPDCYKFYAIYDNTPSGKSDYAKYSKLQNFFPGLMLNSFDLNKLSFHELQEKLQALDGNSLVLLLSAYKDKTSQSHDFTKSFQLIKSSCKRPIFHLWEHGLGEGIFGGKIISHFEQGKRAGELALAILSGKPTQAAKMTSPNQYQFDYNELQKHHISTSSLPAGSLIRNKPTTFYQQHKTLLWSLFSSVLTLTGIIIIAILYIILLTKTKQEIQLEEVKYHTLVENIPQKIFMKDINSVYKSCNSHFSDLVEMEIEEIAGKTDYDLFPEELAEKFVADDKRIIASGNTEDIEEIYMSGNQEAWAHTIKTPVKNQEGEITGVLGIFWDITPQKQAAQEIRRLNVELEQRVIERTKELLNALEAKQKSEKELQKAKEAAEIASKTKSDFIAKISHEIRTPMNSIIGFSGLLQEKVTEPELKNYIEAVISSSKSLLHLINDLLDISKVEAGKLELQYNPVDIIEIINNIKQMFLTLINEKKLDFIIDTQLETPGYLYLDEVRVKQILTNLISNALKFTDAGFIKVTLKTTDSPANQNHVRLELSVEDSGIGISENDRQTIFKAFEQCPGQSRHKYGGTGLGLAISKQLTELMGGTVNLQSTVGKGALFTITIPNVRFIPQSSLPSDTVPLTIENIVETQAADEEELLPAETTPLDNTKLSSLKNRIEQDFVPLWQERDHFSTDQMNNFIKSLKHLLHKNHYQPFVDWVELLSTLATTFELDKLETELNLLPSLLKRLEQTIKEGHHNE